MHKKLYHIKKYIIKVLYLSSPIEKVHTIASRFNPQGEDL